jgi:geranylgeranyl diphosphate synthase type II
MTQVASLAEYLDVRRAQIDAALERYLPVPPACPQGLYDAMRYSLRAGGKRLRPILTLAAAETVGGAAGSPAATSAIETALPAACAIEFIHTYSLIHDDLPAMDDDSLRRGQPTNHIVHGDGMAILAGDGLLTEAFALMAAEPQDPALTPRKLRAIKVVATAAGATGMVGGQAIDLLAVGSASSFDAERLQDMHARKTGALIRAAATAGAIMAGAGEDAIFAVEEFGRHVGLAFQIVDDILDVEGDAQRLGKTAGKDAKAGKPTYPSIFGLEASRRLAAERHEKALAALRSAGLHRGRLADIASWVIQRHN